MLPYLWIVLLVEALQNPITGLPSLRDGGRGGVRKTVPSNLKTVGVGC